MTYIPRFTVCGKGSLMDCHVKYSQWRRLQFVSEICNKTIDKVIYGYTVLLLYLNKLAWYIPINILTCKILGRNEGS